jgi:preprotein translocase subunit SecB
MVRKDKRDGGSKKTNDGPPQDLPDAAPEGAASPPSGMQRGPSGAQLSVLAQYIKDLSFESPAAPMSLEGPGQNPQLRVNVNVNAGPRGEDLYEVVLNIEAHARNDTGVIYNVELLYGGLFRLRNIPENMLQPVLFVDCPTLLFPFVRRALADVTADGGFPPLMLDPIDFGKLYAQNLARAGQDQPTQVKN